MSVIETVTLIGALGSIILSLATVGLQWKKWTTSEQPASAANAAGELTDTSLALVAAVRREMETDRERARAEMTAMRAELAAVRLENQQFRAKLDDFDDIKDWAERLVYQVKSLGGEPVKMKIRTAKA